MRLSTRLLAAVCLLAASLTAISGCSDKSSKPEDTCIPLPGVCATPEEALLAIKEVYNTRAPAALDSLLATDFAFELSPEDAGQPGMPEGWGRNTELALHTLMFSGDLVQSLTLDFVIGPRVYDPVEQLWTITITNVDLYLHGATPDHPTPTTYRVQDGTAKFWFRPTDRNPCSDEGAWKIVKWEDMPIEGSSPRGLALPPAEPDSWGSIKCIYRAGSGSVEPSSWGAVKSRYALPPAENTTWGSIKCLFC